MHQADVQFLYETALADPALGDDDRHPRTRELAIGALRRDGVEHAAQPSEFPLAPMKAELPALRFRGIRHANQSPRAYCRASPTSFKQRMSTMSRPSWQTRHKPV
jgi:hypothetical protein